MTTSTETKTEGDAVMPTRKTHAEDMEETIQDKMPDFPLIPGSKGFCLTLKKHIRELKLILEELTTNAQQ